MDGDDGSRVPWQYAFVASNCLDFILKRRVRHSCHRTEHSWAAGDLVSAFLPLARTSQAQSLALGRFDFALMAKGMADGRSLTSFAPRSRTRFSKTSMVLVLVLVLIKDHFFIKRILTQKASVYPGFILMSVVRI